jgi:hypothetical protein
MTHAPAGSSLLDEYQAERMLKERPHTVLFQWDLGIRSIGWSRF